MSCAPRIGRGAASLPHPFGLVPTNTAVLDAANGIKITLLRNVSFSIKIKGRQDHPWMFMLKASTSGLAVTRLEKRPFKKVL